MKVVLIGKGIMLSAMIRGCLNTYNVDIAGVLRYENITENRLWLWIKDFFRHCSEKTLIKRNNLRELHFKSVNSAGFRKFLIKNSVDAVIVGTWREKISEETFSIPPLGFINIHPSLLPKYRGPNPYLQVIKNREKFSGFTFHLIDENFDTGKILFKKQLEIPRFYTAKELRETTVFAVEKSLPEFLKQYEDGKIKPVKQNVRGASYFPNITRDDMMLDFKKETALEIIARIKALHPWLPCYVTAGNDFYIPNPYKLKIEKSSKVTFSLDDKKKIIRAKCKDGRTVVMRDVRKYSKFFGLFITQIQKLFLWFGIVRHY